MTMSTSVRSERLWKSKQKESKRRKQGLQLNGVGALVGDNDRV